MRFVEGIGRNAQQRRVGSPPGVALCRTALRLTSSKDPVSSSHLAGVAQLVEHQLPKLDVAGSSPVARSSREYKDRLALVGASLSFFA